MKKDKKSKLIYIYIITILTSICLFIVLTGSKLNNPKLKPPVNTVVSDVVEIDTLSGFGLERPITKFPHDLHTKSLIKTSITTNKDCSLCHPVSEDGKNISIKFKRFEDPKDKDDFINLYHDNCLECHEEKNKAGMTNAPLACGECHKESVAEKKRPSIPFEKQIHQLHVKAEDNKCEVCHHGYDETTKKKVYQKGKEQACSDCHGKEGYVSLRQSSHQNCVACHLEKKIQPLECAGCHDANNVSRWQTFFKNIGNTGTRLNRNQPDMILLSAPAKEQAQSKMKKVPFNHKSHEAANDTCRVCHHETVQACKDCHTLYGDDKTGTPNLETAMHKVSNQASCIGCHNKEKSQTNCAGCHSLISVKSSNENTCKVCHTGKSKLSETDHSSYTMSDIPETVTIDKYVNKYNKVVFPHRQVINSLEGKTERNKMAVRFHISKDTLCQGCHHNTPVGETPPLCSSCHDNQKKLAGKKEKNMPGLIGAYHQQCMGCHTKMNLEYLNECEKCHEEKK